MPQNWKTYKLSELSDVIMGQSPKGDTTNRNGNGVPLLNGPTEFGYSYPTPSQFTVDPKKMSEIGDLLFCVRGSTTGRMNYSDQPYAIGRGIGVFRGINGYPTKFVKYIIDNNLNNMLALCTGSTFPNLSRNELENFEVNTCSPNEAKVIASILSTLDDKIELNLQMNKTLEEMAMALYKHWFVDFGPFQNGEFVDSELGKIPKGWEVKRLIDYCDNTQYGYTQSSSLENIGPKFLRITDIQGGNVNWAEVPYCISSDKDLEKYRIKKGDLFVARTGNSTGENVYVLNPPEAVFASYLIRFQFEELYQSAYAAKIFRSLRFFNFIDGAKVGSAQPGISASALGDFTIVCPPNNVTKEFFHHTHVCDEKKEQNLIENQTLTKLRNTLLPKLISGEVRVKDVEQQIAKAI